MIRRHAFLLAMTIVLAFAAYAGAARAMRATPTAAAVVDLPRVIENLKEQQAVRADLTGRQEQLKQQLDAKRKAANSLQGDLDLLQAGTPAYSTKQSELDKAVIDLQVWGEFEGRKLRMEEQLQVEALLRKVNDAVARVAQDNGYDVVFFKGQQIGMQRDGQPAQANLRYVAYAAESIDLTDQVVQRMNNEFGAGK